MSCREFCSRARLLRACSLHWTAAAGGGGQSAAECTTTAQLERGGVLVCAWSEILTKTKLPNLVPISFDYRRAPGAGSGAGLEGAVLKGGSGFTEKSRMPGAH